MNRLSADYINAIAEFADPISIIRWRCCNTKYALLPYSTPSLEEQKWIDIKSDTTFDDFEISSILDTSLGWYVKQFAFPKQIDEHNVWSLDSTNVSCDVYSAISNMYTDDLNVLQLLTNVYKYVTDKPSFMEAITYCAESIPCWYDVNGAIQYAKVHFSGCA